MSVTQIENGPETYVVRRLATNGPRYRWVPALAAGLLIFGSLWGFAMYIVAL